MRTTRVEARRILRRVYPDIQSLYITSRVRVANVPVARLLCGEPMLAWRAERKYSPVAYADDVVEIGRVLNPGEPGLMDIDWNWAPEAPK